MDIVRAVILLRLRVAEREPDRARDDIQLGVVREGCAFRDRIDVLERNRVGVGELCSVKEEMDIQLTMCIRHIMKMAN